MTNRMGSTTLRGKNLHPDLAQRVLSLYNTEHYSEAVLNAFKVIEERLRAITGKHDADRRQLLKETFNPTTGTLHKPKAWQSERQGIYSFIEGAFLTFRNPPAHRFVETDAEEAFDLIVLANRILLLIDERHAGWATRPKEVAPPETANPTLLGLLRNFYRSTESDDIWILDTDNDDSDEIVMPSYANDGQIIRIDHWNSKTGFVDGILQPVEPSFAATDVVMADVDNDGQPEIVCTALAAYHSLTLFYKYTGDYKYELLTKDPDTASMEGLKSPWFLNASIVDFDQDGQIEVISEPRQEGYLPSPARYIWRWNKEALFFEVAIIEQLSDEPNS